MEILALVLFVLAAVLGIAMVVQLLGETEIPGVGVALTHGAAGAAALILAILSLVGADALEGVGLAAVVLFLVAALGGAVLFLGFHLRGQPLPVIFGLVHGVVALAAFILLLVAFFG